MFLNISRVRTLPARGEEPERVLLIVVFDGDTRAQEFGVAAGPGSTQGIRFPASSLTARVGYPPTWVRCDHGAVLVHGGDESTEYPGYSCTRCRVGHCLRFHMDWFQKFCTTDAWETNFGGGREASLLAL